MAEPTIAGQPLDDFAWRTLQFMQQTVHAKVNETAELIQTFHNMFLTTGEVDYIDTAIALATELTTTPGCQFGGLNVLVLRLNDIKAGLIKPSAPLEFSVRDGSKGDITDPAGSSNASYQLSRLYTERYEECRGVEDLKKAISQTEEALAVTPIGHPDRIAILRSLCNLINDRHKQSGTVEDLQLALERNQELLNATPADHPYHRTSLSSLAALLLSRFERLGKLEDLENAIERAEEAVAATPADCLSRAGIFNNLANVLQSRYERLGKLEDLENAIQWAEEAVAATPADCLSRAGIFNNLANVLQSRYERLGKLEDLENAIQWAEEAVAAIPADHPDCASIFNNLANVLQSRYERLGKLEDLENAIQRAEEAVAATPADHPDRAGRFNNLANVLQSRYERLGKLEDLENAIQWAEEAVAATPVDHSDRASRFINLANHLHSRYKRLGKLEDLENAIKWTEEAVETTPADHPLKTILLNSLGIMLGHRFQLSGSSNDLEMCISRLEEAVAIPAGDIKLAGVINNLSKWLSVRHNQSGNPKDIEKVINLQKRAVEVTPADHLDRGGLLSALGASLFERYTNTDDKQDLLYALSVTKDAWDCTVSPPSMRITAAGRAATYLTILHRWKESSSLLEDAVKLLPVLSPRFLERNDQEHQLSNLSQIAMDAASISLEAGKEASHCLTLLELGRGIINGLTIDCRNDLSELKVKNRDLFEDFNRLRTEIDFPYKSSESNYQQKWNRQLEVIDGLEKTLIRIRGLPGFSDFQCPPSPAKLMTAAREGPIVIINSTLFRSDAIIVTDSLIKALPLPALSHGDVKRRMKGLRESLIQGKQSTYRSRNEQLHEFLLWLWDTTVGPVFQELDLRPVAEGTIPPRVWWVGTGPLAMAPFHAAGDHTEGSARNTISRAVSSYIPTIKALSYARDRKLELLCRADSNLLQVTMPTTPGNNNDLSSVNREASEISEAIGESASVRLLIQPSATEVLDLLQTYQAVHFACHGIPDNKDPSNSHLLLFNKESGMVDPLTAGAIASRNIKTAQIAYLSACSTADNHGVKLPDESIHIAGGFQLAGFSHILATLWKSKDDACQEVAVEFYRILFDGQGDKGHSKVSLAFHQAVSKLRKKYIRQPIIWTSFIHTGA